MISELFYLILVITLLLIGSYFSACETALTAYSKPKMFSMAQDGNKKAQVLMFYVLIYLVIQLYSMDQ